MTTNFENSAKETASDLVTKVPSSELLHEYMIESSKSSALRKEVAVLAEPPKQPAEQWNTKYPSESRLVNDSTHNLQVFGDAAWRSIAAGVVKGTLETSYADILNVPKFFDNAVFGLAIGAVTQIFVPKLILARRIGQAVITTAITAPAAIDAVKAWQDLQISSTDEQAKKAGVKLGTSIGVATAGLPVALLTRRFSGPLMSFLPIGAALVPIRKKHTETDNQSALSNYRAEQ